MPTNKFLALYLDGPLQSWGYQSRFRRRTTASYPVKSGVIGMLCAALGVERDDEFEITRLASLGMEVLVFGNPGRITDYHTVGGGYDRKTEKMFMSSIADGGTPRTIVTQRDYLVDGRFGVVLEGDSVLTEACHRALTNPKWGLWLGRKCCIAAAPISLGVFENRNEAIIRLEETAGRKANRSIKEAATFKEGTDSLSDVPVNFQERTFAPRRIIDESKSE